MTAVAVYWRPRLDRSNLPPLSVSCLRNCGDVLFAEAAGRASGDPAVEHGLLPICALDDADCQLTAVAGVRPKIGADKILVVLVDAEPRSVAG